MNFYEFLNTRNSNNSCTSRASYALNESVNFKAGDLAFYTDDQYGETVGLLIIGKLMKGYIATTGGMIGVYIPKSVSKFKTTELGTCVWIDSNGKVNGKTPVSKFDGTFDQFMNMLDGYDEED